MRLSPRDPARATWFSQAGFAAFAPKHYDGGIEWALRGEKENPGRPSVYRMLAANCRQAGRKEKSRAAVAELRGVAPDITIEMTRTQVPCKYPADMERYLDGLRKACLPEA